MSIRSFTPQVYTLRISMDPMNQLLAMCVEKAQRLKQEKQENVHLTFLKRVRHVKKDYSNYHVLMNLKEKKNEEVYQFE